MNQNLVREISKSDLDIESLSNIVKNFTKAKILVIGDLILDEYLLARPERISREAPVMILNYIKSKYALGGAGNAAANIRSFAANVHMLTVVGKDSSASELESLSKADSLKDSTEDIKNIDLHLVRSAERMTTVKTRIISTSNSNDDNGTVLKQQVLRVDRQERQSINSEEETLLLTELDSIIANNDIDLILLSDYSSGVLTESVVNKALSLAKAKEIKVLVDSTGDFNKYKGAYIITPNQPDLESMLKIRIKSDEDLFAAAKELLLRLDNEYLLVTRGAKGMVLFGKNAEVITIPAFNKSEVFDVTGAGDTVAATLALGLATGATALDSVLLGNLAASLVVRKYGTASISQAELLDLLSVANL